MWATPWQGLNLPKKSLSSMTLSLDITMKNKILMGVVGVSVLILNGCSSQFEKGVKQGCYNMGGSRSYCSCVYDKVEEHYGRKVMRQIERMTYLPNDLDRVMYQSGQQCVDKL